MAAMNRSRSRSRSSSTEERSRKKRVGGDGDGHRSSKSASRERTNGDGGSEHIVTLHGLPYSATEEEIIDFLVGCSIVGGKKGIHYAKGDDGRFNGDCFVELATDDDVRTALDKHRKNLGRRYVEVFKSTKAEMDYELRDKSLSSGSSDSIVRLRGLPFECTKEEIASFFLGLAIVPNGITILTDGMGRTLGDGFVQFTDADLVEKAVAKHKEKIRHRYIEVYRSSFPEMKTKMMRAGTGFGGGGGGAAFGRSSRSGPYDRPSRFLSDALMFGRFGNNDNFGFGGGGGYGGGGRFSGGSNSRFGGGGRFGGGTSFGGGGGGPMRGRGGRDGGRNDEYISHTGHYLHMRGLPFSATEDDVAKFFEPIVPVNIYIDYDRNGRATGEANVDFDSSGDARDALRKHKHMMQHRYIELYLNSQGPSSSGGGGGGGYRSRF